MCALQFPGAVSITKTNTITGATATSETFSITLTNKRVTTGSEHSQKG